MPSKSTDKKKKTSEKGTVGVHYAGLLKSRACQLFWTTASDPQDEHDKSVKSYGQFTRSRFVVCENPEKVMGKVAKEFNDLNDYDDLYTCNNSTMIDKIKEVAGVNKAKTLGDPKPRPKAAADGNGSDDEDNSDDEKPAKVSKKAGKSDKKTDKKAGKKDDKKSGKKGGKNSKKDQESDAEESDAEESDAEGSDAEDSGAEDSGAEESDAEGSDAEESEDEAPAKKPSKSSKGSKGSKKDDSKKTKRK